MRIGGFQPFTLIDYPGKIAAIVFTQGCNFRCGYCHNPQLVCADQFQPPLAVDDILNFLETRKGKLEGVVITGGEPTIQKGLVDFITQIKAMDFAVKLDTNGTNPDLLASLIELGLVDYIAMDVKTSWARYGEAVGVKVNTDNIKRSMKIIQSSGIRHQFRTTLVKPHCSPEDVTAIRELVGGDRHYVLQSFIPWPNIIDPALLDKAQYTTQEIAGLKAAYQRI